MEVGDVQLLRQQLVDVRTWAVTGTATCYLSCYSCENSSIQEQVVIVCSTNVVEALSACAVLPCGF
jgi:hypothetical protein